MRFGFLYSEVENGKTKMYSNAYNDLPTAKSVARNLHKRGFTIMEELVMSDSGSVFSDNYGFPVPWMNRELCEEEGV